MSSEIGSEWNVEQHLLQHSELYRRTRETRRTKAHTFFEHFVRELVRRLGGATYLVDRPSPEQLSTLRRDLEAGAFGRAQGVAERLDRFGPSGLHPDLVALFSAQVRLTPEQEVLYERCNARHPLPRVKFLQNFHALCNEVCKPSEDVPLHKRKHAAQKLGRNNPLIAAKATHTVAELARRLRETEPRVAARFGLRKGRVVERRVDVLLTCGFPPDREPELRSELARRAQMQRQAEDLAKRMGLSPDATRRAVPLFLLLLLELGGVDAEQALQLAPDRALALVRGGGRVEGHGLVQMMLATLAQQRGRDDLAAFLRDHADRRVNPQNQSAARLQSLSPWHAELWAKELALQHRTASNEHNASYRAHKFARFVLRLDAFARARSEPATDEPALLRFLRQATPEDLDEFLCQYVEHVQPRPQQLRCRSPEHFALVHIKDVRAGLRKLAHFACLPGLLRVLQHVSTRAIQEAIPDTRVALRAARGAQGRCFTSDEQARLCAVTPVHPAESVMRRLLQEVALRGGFLGRVQYKMLLSLEDHEPLAECSVPEKNGAVRRFAPSPELREELRALGAWLRARHGADALANLYVFNLRNPSRPLSHSAVSDWVHGLAERAGVTHAKAHPHAFRHTLITRLLNQGAAIDEVARAFQHDSVETTSNFYWDPELADLRGAMRLPFEEPDDG